MPLGLCSCIYGTTPAHFEEFGFISPTQANCLTQDGLILCIQDKTICGISEEPTTISTPEPTTKPTTKPTTISTTISTTEPTTKPTTISTTEPTTKPTTISTTKPTTISTTKPTTQTTASTSEEATWGPWTTAISYGPWTPASTSTTTQSPLAPWKPTHVTNIIGPKPTYNMNSVITGPQVFYTKDKYGRTVFKKIIPGKVYWKENSVTYD